MGKIIRKTTSQMFFCIDYELVCKGNLKEYKGLVKVQKTRKASEESEAFIVVALTGQFSNRFHDDLKRINSE